MILCYDWNITKIIIMIIIITVIITIWRFPEVEVPLHHPF